MLLTVLIVVKSASKGKAYRWFALLARFYVVLIIAQSQCVNGTVRLQDGPTQFEGRVEVCLAEEWRTVCNDFWGHNEALVVCRQLGFSTSGEYS